MSDNKAILSLAFDSPVASLRGKIHTLYPPLTGTKRGIPYALQNGSLIDESGVEVNFMLNKFPSFWDQRIYRGGFVEFRSTGEETMVWRQQTRDGRPTVEGKVEIQKAVQVVKLVTRDEYEGGGRAFPVRTEPDLFSHAGRAESQTLAAAPTTAPARAAVANGAQTEAGVLTEARRYAAAFVLAGREAEWVLGKMGDIEKLGVDRSQVFCATTASIYGQMTQDGLHRRINLADFDVVLERPTLAKVAQLVEGKEDRANQLLRVTKHIGDSQTWRDLTEEAAAEVLAQNVLSFLSK